MQLEDLFTPASLAGTVSDSAHMAGPYVLALFGVLLVVGIAMALIGRAQKGIVAKFR
jgi:hypothetical protein